ncbi:LysR family transcriptional regulator [Belnapia rosea]|uniref:DNA-binding transcriptional regulator, LysR family n=1 Tax=Belnapia rosea TaxID=938405 RepID=A0A1G6SZC0_9PROT|nr:LysR family transcriptional regulator [Belnapia rosea]SDD21974.1 DNA-binding transcriptional regulator, LysR family [Belnapia rosea]
MISNPLFDLLDLRLIQRIARAGSLSAAGAALGLTPAAASRRLAVLERRLGLPLFARTTRRLRPTAEGEAFLPHVERILAATAEAEAALPGGTGALSGTLRFTAPATFGRKVLAPMLSGLLAAHPGLRLDLLLTDTLLDLVATGRDAAVRIRPTPRMLSNSNEALREACLAGLGIGLHSTWDVGEHLRRGELVALPPTLGVPEQLGIWLVFPGGIAAPARIRVLTEHLVQAFGPIPPWER